MLDVLSHLWFLFVYNLFLGNFIKQYAEDILRYYHWFWLLKLLKICRIITIAIGAVPRDTDACALRYNTSADKTVVSRVKFLALKAVLVWPDVCSKRPGIIVTLIESRRNKIVDSGCSFMKKIENNSGFFGMLLAMTFCTTYINAREGPENPWAVTMRYCDLVGYVTFVTRVYIFIMLFFCCSFIVTPYNHRRYGVDNNNYLRVYLLSWITFKK